MVEYNRRKFVQHATALSIGTLGVASSSSVTAKGGNRAVVVPRDKFEQLNIGRIIDEISVMSTRGNGSKVVLLWDVPQVRQQIMEPGEWDNNKSVEENISDSKAMSETWESHRKNEARFEDTFDQSPEDSPEQIGTLDHDTVSLGEDVTFYECESGDSGQGGFGLHDSEGEIRLGNDHIHTEAFTYPPGGTANARGWVGNEFAVTGSGSQTATIIADIGYLGHTFAAAVGTLSFNIKFRVRNLTDNTISDQTTMKSVNKAVAHWAQHRNEHKRYSLHIPLRAGKRYRPEIKVSADSTAFTEGGATVDFGKFEDSGYEYVDAKWFEIKF